MVMVSFLSGVIGLVITGYTMLFSAQVHMRITGVGVIGIAAVVVGGLLTAQLNGGRPYGYDMPVGLDQWRRIEHVAPATRPIPPRRPANDGTPIA